MIRARLRAVIEGVVKRFTADGRPGETWTNREAFQHYGFTSRPLDGAEGILLREGNFVALVAEDDRRYRIELEAGEVALYTDEGDRIHLKRDKTLDIVSGHQVNVTAADKVVVTAPEVEVVATSKVTVTSPTTEISGDVSIGGNVTVAGTAAVTGALSSETSVSDPNGTMQAMRDVYNPHRHGNSAPPMPQMGPA